LLSKFGNLSIPKNFGCDVSVRPSIRPSVRTDSGGGGGRSQDNPTGGGDDIFPWREIVQCFWATAFFLVGNRMTIVAFEKEISLKSLSLSLSLFSKTIVRQYCSFKLEKKTSNIYKSVERKSSKEYW